MLKCLKMAIRVPSNQPYQAEHDAILAEKPAAVSVFSTEQSQQSKQRSAYCQFDNYPKKIKI